MKISLDTANDQPRLIRTAIAMLLGALDDGSALPNTPPAGLVYTGNEVPPAPGPDAREAFGGGAVPLAQPAPSIAVAPPPPPAPVVPPVTSVMPPAPPAPVPPPAAPVPPVHSAPVPPPPPAPAGNTVALDKEGLPWDARIHAATKSKIANGTWKRKKGLPEETFAAVVAELRQTMAIPAPVGTVAYAPPPPPPAASAVPPAPPAAPPAPPAAPASDPANFAEFMAWIAGLIAAGKWTHPQTSTALGSIGLPGAVALASRPDLIPSAVAVIRGMLPA